MRTSIGIAVAVAVALGASGPVSAATPGAIVDQGNGARQPPCAYTAWAPDFATSWAAQTFTVAVAGSLTDVVLPLRVRSVPLLVAIAPVDTGGVPVVGSPLASATVSPPFTASGYDDVAVSFSPAPRVEAGKQYAIVLRSPATVADDPPTGVGWKADLGSSLRDGGNNPCADGAYAKGRVFVSNDPGFSFGADADFFFQTYVVPLRRVTVQLAGAGTGVVQDATRAIDCGLLCGGAFTSGETVSLTATPQRESRFVGWSGGGCAGSVPTCSFAATEDASVTAAFAATAAAVRLRVAGRGTVSATRGGPCGTSCLRVLPVGTVTLTAAPRRGWRFVRWQGGCRGTVPVCRFTLTEPASLTAVFALQHH